MSKWFAVAFVLLVGSATLADNPSSGYVLESPVAITYLRLIPHGTWLSGYELSLTADANVGFAVARQDFTASLSGDAIDLNIGGTEFDGTCTNQRLTLDEPVNGLITKVTFTGISVDKWNKHAARFEREWTLYAQGNRVRTDYDAQQAIYDHGKTQLASAQLRLPDAEARQKQRQADTDAAQAEIDRLRAIYEALNAKAQANPTFDQAAADANLALAKATWNYDVVSGYFGGLSSAKDDVTNAQNDINGAHRTMDTAAAQMAQDVATYTSIRNQLRAASGGGPTVARSPTEPTGPTQDAKADHQEFPEIPDDLKAKDFQTSVRVRVEITADGAFTPYLRSSSGNTEIDQRVLEALSKWTWKPALKNGVPIASTQYFRFDFEVQ